MLICHGPVSLCFISVVTRISQASSFNSFSSLWWILLLCECSSSVLACMGVLVTSSSPIPQLKSGMDISRVTSAYVFFVNYLSESYSQGHLRRRAVSELSWFFADGCNSGPLLLHYYISSCYPIKCLNFIDETILMVMQFAL